jgi:hypothetical protein
VTTLDLSRIKPAGSRRRQHRFMREPGSDRSGCTCEGFSALARVEVRLRDRAIVATLNVVDSPLRDLESHPFIGVDGSARVRNPHTRSLS